MIPALPLRAHHVRAEETQARFIAVQLAAFALEDTAESCNHGLDEGRG